MVLLLKIRVNYLSVKKFFRELKVKLVDLPKNLKKQVVEYPIAHSQGKFYAERKILKNLGIMIKLHSNIHLPQVTQVQNIIQMGR